MKFKIYVENRDLFENWMTVDPDTINDLKKLPLPSKITDDLLISFYKSIKVMENPFGKNLSFKKLQYNTVKNEIIKASDTDFAFGLEIKIKNLIKKENMSDAERFATGKNQSDNAFR
jgi:hypothetical protein